MVPEESRHLINQLKAKTNRSKNYEKLRKEVYKTYQIFGLEMDFYTKITNQRIRENNNRRN